MYTKLSETTEICGSSESGHKMAVLLDIISRDQFAVLIMKAAVPSEAFRYTSTKSTGHRLPGEIIIHFNRLDAVRTVHHDAICIQTNKTHKFL